MKVYELIGMLEDVPAGYDVIFVDSGGNEIKEAATEANETEREFAIYIHTDEEV